MHILSKNVLLLVLVLIVGILSGLAAVLFHLCIGVFLHLFYGFTEGGSFLDFARTLPLYVTLGIPTLAGLIVGIVVKYAHVPGIAGEGVSEVIEAIDHKDGWIDARTAPMKLFLSAVSIGGGGAGGREGPIIQIGASIGSSLGRWFKQGTAEIKTLIGSGTASIIGGTLHAPLTGLCFAYEILLRKFDVRGAIFIVAGAFFGTFIAEHILDTAHPLFFINTTASLNSPLVLLLLLPLGIITGAIGVFFNRMLSYSRNFFTHLKIRFVLRPALGGFFVGAIALSFPEIQEPASLSVIHLLFETTVPLVFLSGYIFYKMVGTASTLGSGGAGGVLMPSMLVGGSIGALYAQVFMSIGLGPEHAIVFVLIGMGSFFSALAHAPLTATLLILELTHAYILTIPLVIICFLSKFVAARLDPNSIYHALKNADRSLEV